MSKTKAGPVSAEAIRGFSDRINNLLDEKQGITSDVGELYDEAKKAGVNTKALRKIIAKRRAKAPDPEVEAAMEAYDLALDAAAGMVSNGSTSLRKAAKETGFSKSAIQRQVSHREKPRSVGQEDSRAAEDVDGGEQSGEGHDEPSDPPSAQPESKAGAAGGADAPAPVPDDDVVRLAAATMALPIKSAAAVVAVLAAVTDKDGLTIPDFLRGTRVTG